MRVVKYKYYTRHSVLFGKNFLYRRKVGSRSYRYLDELTRDRRGRPTARWIELIGRPPLIAITKEEALAIFPKWLHKIT